MFEITPESYQDSPRAMTMARILQGFEAVFGITPGRVSTKFRTALQEMLDKEYPRLRCSTARAVLEGRIPGLPVPVTPQREQKHLRQALFLLDALETMAGAFREEPPILTEAAVAFDAPTTPGSLETMDAIKNGKTTQGNGSSLPRKKHPQHSQKSRV